MSEGEKMADPRVKWALDILDDEGIDSTPLVGHYLVPFMSALGGFASVAYPNFINNRPYYARGGRLIGATLAGLAVGFLARDYVGFKFAQRDGALKDYLIKHPELFPEPERKKFGDSVVILPWAIRR